MDIMDEMMVKASASGEKYQAVEIDKRIFSLNIWHAIPVGKEGDWRPFVGVTDDIPTLYLFTEPEKARKAAIAHELAKEEDEQFASLALPVKKLVEKADDYIALGIKRIVINMLWQIPFENIRTMYDYYSKLHDFQELTAKAKTGIEGVVEFWDAMTGLEQWFFVGNMEEKHLFLSGGDANYVVVFLDYSSAMALLDTLHEKDVGKDWTPIPMIPEDAIGFIKEITEKNEDVAGMIYTDGLVYEGMPIDKVIEMDEIVKKEKGGK